MLTPRHEGRPGSRPNKLRRILKRGVGVLAMTAAFGGQAVGNAQQTLAQRRPSAAGSSEPVLTQKITRDMPSVASTILNDYRKAKPRFRQHRVLTGMGAGTTEPIIQVEYDASSKITGHKSEYILQAEFLKQDSQRGLNPSSVVQITVEEPPRIIPSPLGRNSSTEYTYAFSADKSYNPESATGAQWTVDTTYYVGPPTHLVNEPQDYVAHDWTTGPSDPFLHDALSSTLYPKLLGQVRSVVHDAPAHTPITVETPHG